MASFRPSVVSKNKPSNMHCFKMFLGYRLINGYFNHEWWQYSVIGMILFPFWSTFRITSIYLPLSRQLMVFYRISDRFRMLQVLSNTFYKNFCKETSCLMKRNSSSVKTIIVLYEISCAKILCIPRCI